MDESRNRLTEEGYALNLIGHVVSDLSKGGPGIRYILDLWVYRHRHKTQPDWDAVWKRMRQDKIDIAAKNLIDLSEYLFGDGEETELLKELSEYVLSGGLYGDAKRSAASEAARAGGISGAFFRQIFRNRSEYENRYPWLKEYRFLFPGAMLLRIVKSLKGNRNRIKMWIFDIKTIKRDDIKTQYECLSRFGL